MKRLVLAALQVGKSKTEGLLPEGSSCCIIPQKQGRQEGLEKQGLTDEGGEERREEERKGGEGGKVR